MNESLNLFFSSVDDDDLWIIYNVCDQSGNYRCNTIWLICFVLSFPPLLFLLISFHIRSSTLNNQCNRKNVAVPCVRCIEKLAIIGCQWQCHYKNHSFVRPVGQVQKHLSKCMCILCVHKRVPVCYCIIFIVCVVAIATALFLCGQCFIGAEMPIKFYKQGTFGAVFLFSICCYFPLQRLILFDCVCAVSMPFISTKCIVLLLFFNLFFCFSFNFFLSIKANERIWIIYFVKYRTVTPYIAQCRINVVIVVGMLITITLRTPMPMGIKPMPKTIHQVQNYRTPYHQHRRRPRHCLSHHRYRQPRQLRQQLRQVILHESLSIMHRTLLHLILCVILFFGFIWCY